MSSSLVRLSAGEAEALREAALRRIEEELRLASTGTLEAALLEGEAAAVRSPDGGEWEPTLRLIRWELERRRRRPSS